MKKRLFVSLIAVFAILLTQAQNSWEIVNPPLIEDFVSLCFTDAAHAWIISETGTVISTSDSGNTWETSSFPDVHFESIHFSDNNHGCIVGWQETPSDSSLIMITNDGGGNWLMIDHVRVNHLNDVSFINNEIGWAVGSYTELNRNCCLYTSDGGANWYHQPSMTIVGAELYGVSFRDENTGQICGYDGAFFLTNDGGSNWAMNIATPMPLLNLNAIFNWGVLTGCIVGEEGIALYTTNNWYQYIVTVTNTSENLNGISGDPATNKLWAAGDNGTIIYSPSYLLGWTAQPTGVTENLNDIQMLSETNGWAVGDNGTILHYSLATAICQGKELQIEIYPNPTNGILNVKLNDENDIKKMQIMTMNGEMVFEANVTRGYFNHDLRNLSKGIYFVYFTSDNDPIIKKIVIK